MEVKQYKGNPTIFCFCSYAQTQNLPFSFLLLRRTTTKQPWHTPRIKGVLKWYAFRIFCEVIIVMDMSWQHITIHNKKWRQASRIKTQRGGGRKSPLEEMDTNEWILNLKIFWYTLCYLICFDLVLCHSRPSSKESSCGTQNCHGHHMAWHLRSEVAHFDSPPTVTLALCKARKQS